MDQFIRQRLAMNASVLNLYEQSALLTQQIPLITSSILLAQQESLFQAKAVQLLQLRSKYVANTTQYAKFEHHLSHIPNPISFESMKKAYDLSANSPYESDSTEASCNSSSETPIRNPLGTFEELDKKKPVLIQSNHPQRVSSSNMMEVKIEHQGKTDLPKRNQTTNIRRNFIESPYNSESDLKKELERVSKFVLANIGKGNETLITNGRKMFSHNILLQEAYDALVKKYFSSKKVKEDIVRYIIRKALKTIKKPVIENKKVQGKQALVLLCKRYFSDQFEQGNMNPEHEEELAETLLPYNEKSKNRTMNTNFVKEIFSSEEFLKDYREFLPNMESMLKKDNEKKFNKLISALLECAKVKNFSKIAGLKVFPWIDSWVEETLETANQLSNLHKTACGEKKLKC